MRLLFDTIRHVLLCHASLNLQRRTGGTFGQRQNEQISSVSLKLNLLYIAARRDCIANAREATSAFIHTAKLVDSSPPLEGKLPQALRSLLLKSRRAFEAMEDLKKEKSSFGSVRDLGGEEHLPTDIDFLPSAMVADLIPSPVAFHDFAPHAVDKWYAAFCVFSEAVTQHAVVPTIEHINVLLAITIRERLWLQLQQVEMFVDKLFLAATDSVCSEAPFVGILDDGDDCDEGETNYACRTPRGSTCFLRPTCETFEWLMAAAVSRQQWVEALLHFQDARGECVPVSECLLKLALHAYRIGGVHSLIGTDSDAGDHPDAPLVSLRTNQRGPQLLRAAAPAQHVFSFSTGVANNKMEEKKSLWEAALIFFMSFTHRLRDESTVALFMSIMAEALQPQVILETYRECSRILPLGEKVLFFVRQAFREVGDWALGLSLFQQMIEQHETAGKVMLKPLLEDVIFVLRGQRSYETILQLRAQLPSAMWTSRARIMAAQALMLRSDLPTLLRLLEEEEEEKEEQAKALTESDNFGDYTNSNPYSNGNLAFETCRSGILSGAGFCYPQNFSVGEKVLLADVEMYDIVLRAIQVELISRHFATGLLDAAASRSGMLQGLSELSVAVYQRFLCNARRQLRTHRDGLCEVFVSVYAPLVRLFEGCTGEEKKDAGRSAGGPSLATWERAFSHLALIRQPDAVVVSLATHLFQSLQQWEAAFVFLVHVIHDKERGCSVRRPHCVHSSNFSDVREVAHSGRYSCTAITAAAIANAVHGAAICNPMAAVQLTQHAFYNGWIDGSKFVQLLSEIKRGSGKRWRKVQRNGEENLFAGTSHNQHDAVDTLLNLITIYDTRRFGSWLPNLLLLDAMRFLQQLQTQVEPSVVALFCAFRKRLEDIVASIAAEGKGERRVETELIVTAALNAVFDQISLSQKNRRALWQECLGCLHFFCSPVAHNSSGLLRVNKSTYCILRAFIRRCDQQEKGFVEGVVLGWLLGSLSFFPEVFYTLLYTSPGLVDTTVSLSYMLFVDALVWCGRHRVKDLLRRLVGLLYSFFQKVIQRDAGVLPTKGDFRGLRSDTLNALIIAVQCITSGPHKEVLCDWPLLQQLLCLLLEADELVAPPSNAVVGGTVSCFADSLAAVLDKLRRTFHFLIVKISLDAQHQRGSQGDKRVLLPSQENNATYIEKLVENGAVAYIDLCKAFVQRFFATADSDYLVRSHGRIRECIAKVMNCVWDVNYTLHVWHFFFKITHPFSNISAFLKKSYRWLLGSQILLLPASYTTSQQIERWLIVMSGCGEETGAKGAMCDGGNAPAALLNDITSLEALQCCHFAFFAEEKLSKLSRQFVVPLVLEAVHSITLAVSKHSPFFLSLAERSVLGRNTTAHRFFHNSNFAQTFFKDHMTVVSPLQLQTIQHAGSALVYVLLCEGCAGPPLMLQNLMSWLGCPHELLGAIMDAARSTSPEALAAAWSSAALVEIFDALKMQGCFWKMAGKDRPANGGVGHVVGLLRILTTCPAVCAAVRINEDICTAALLALLPEDVFGDNEHTTAIKNMVCRFFCAFPKVAESRLLALLLEGKFYDFQLCVIDVLFQHVTRASGILSLGLSPSLMRGIASWFLLRENCDTHKCSNVFFGTRGATRNVFSNIMFLCKFFDDDDDGDNGVYKETGLGQVMSQEQKQFFFSTLKWSKDTVDSITIRRYLKWEQAIELFERVSHAVRPFVDPNLVFFRVVQLYGTQIPQRLGLEIVDTLTKRHAETCLAYLNGDGDAISNHHERLANNLIDHLLHASLWKLFLRQDLIESLVLRQIGEKLCVFIRMTCKECLPEDVDVWKSVFIFLHRLLRDRTLSSCKSLLRSKMQASSLSCLMVEWLVPYMLRYGVSQSKGKDDQQPLIDLPLVTSSLLLLLELVIPSRAVHIVLYRLCKDVLEDSQIGSGTGSNNGLPYRFLPVALQRQVWLSLLHCEVRLLTLSGLVDDSCSTDLAVGVNSALSTSEAIVSILFNFASDFTRYNLSVKNKIGKKEGDLAREALMRLLEFAGRRVISSVLALFFTDRSGSVTIMQKEYATAKRMVAHIVQAALLMGAWRDIYWLASQLLTSIAAEEKQLHNRPEEERRALFAPWRWLVGLLPAMVAGSSRTTSSVQPQVTALVNLLPSELLRNVYFGPNLNLAKMGDFEKTTRGWRQELCDFFCMFHRRILLKTENVLRGGSEKQTASFAQRILQVRPLVQLGVFVGVQRADDAQMANLRELLLFFIDTDETQWLSFMDAVAKESKHLTDSENTLNVAVVNDVSFGITCWQEAVAVLCCTDRKLLYAYFCESNRNEKYSKEVQKVHNASRIFHSFCIAETVPSRVVMELFTHKDGPPHTERLFPVSCTEEVIRQCTSWFSAIELVKHSLSTVPRPTKVQQLLAYLTLYRMRTDTAWVRNEEESSARSVAAPDGRDGGLLSWEVACWCYNQLTWSAAAPSLSQRTMIEILRHCVFHPPAALSAYEAYWKQGYSRTEGVNVFLSLMRAARLARNETLALRAMQDYIRCCDEHDLSVVEGNCGFVRHHMFTSAGNTTLCRSFTHVCRCGFVSRQAAAEIAAALKQRGRIGEVEELLMVSSTNKKHFVTTDEESWKN